MQIRTTSYVLELRRFTVGTCDNSGHNPSNTISKWSLNGSRISVFQMTSSTNPRTIRKIRTLYMSMFNQQLILYCQFFRRVFISFAINVVKGITKFLNLGQTQVIRNDVIHWSKSDPSLSHQNGKAPHVVMFALGVQRTFG